MNAETADDKSPEAVVRALLDAMCRVSVGDDSALVDLDALYAEPTYVLHPMRPELPAVRTREDALHHFALIGQQFSSTPESRRTVDVTVHETGDPDVVVTEFKYETFVEGQRLYTPCIWVTRVQAGRIVEARDYNGQASSTRAPAEYQP